jgi:hypothetical protein
MELNEILEHARDVLETCAKDCVIALWVTNAFITSCPGDRGVRRDPPHDGHLAKPRRRRHAGRAVRPSTWSSPASASPRTRSTRSRRCSTRTSPSTRASTAASPQRSRDLLAEHCAGPHLELFAREEHENWECWGAETSKFATEAA